MDVLPNEKETVKRLVRSDKDAFCELYIAYKPTVIRFCVRMLKSKTLSEDVFQDSFVVIWQSRQFINPEIPFSAYLFTIVKNRILNILREEENLNTIKSAMLAKFSEETNTTHDALLVNDLTALLEKAKENLTSKQREVYELSREQYLSHSQIAEQLQISKNTVREHINMALKQIRDYLNKYGNYSDLVFFIALLNL